MKNLILASAVLFISLNHASAAVNQEVRQISKTETLASLALPIDSRIDTLRSQGPTGYKNLMALMNDETAPMEARWRAVTAMGRLGGKLSLPEMQKAIHSKVWYLRNAALVSATTIDRTQAINWAHELLSDKALVVRSAAVDVMSDLGDTSGKRLLWQKLDAKENYRGKQSLWIRRKIAESLAKLENHGSESKFISLLSDQDTSLHAPAIAALERLTQKKLGKEEESAEAKKSHWIVWWKSHPMTATN